MRLDIDRKALAKDAIALAQMTDESFNELFAALSNLPLLLDTSTEVYSLIHERALLNSEGVAPGDFILYAIYEMANRGDKPVGIVFEGLLDEVAAIATMDNNNSIISTLIERLDKLNGLQKVIVSLKASLLLAERDRLYISSKVINDVRPIFNENLEPSSILILNTLILECQEGDVKKTIQIALDDRDIDSLISQLERAKRKVASIKSTFSSSDVLVIE